MASDLQQAKQSTMSLLLGGSQGHRACAFTERYRQVYQEMGSSTGFLLGGQMEEAAKKANADRDQETQAAVYTAVRKCEQRAAVDIAAVRRDAQERLETLRATLKADIKAIKRQLLVAQQDARCQEGAAEDERRRRKACEADLEGYRHALMVKERARVELQASLEAERSALQTGRDAHAACLRLCDETADKLAAADRKGAALMSVLRWEQTAHEATTAAAEREKAALRAQLADIQQRMQAAEAARAELAAENASLLSKVADADAARAELAAENSGLRRKLADTEVARGELAAEASGLRSKLADTETEHEKLKAYLATWYDEALRASNKMLADQYAAEEAASQAQSQLRALTTRCEQLQQQLAATITTHKQEVDQLWAQRAKLEQDALTSAHKFAKSYTRWMEEAAGDHKSTGESAWTIVEEVRQALVKQDAHLDTPQQVNEACEAPASPSLRTPSVSEGSVHSHDSQTSEDSMSTLGTTSTQTQPHTAATQPATSQQDTAAEPPCPTEQQQQHQPCEDTDARLRSLHAQLQQAHMLAASQAEYIASLVEDRDNLLRLAEIESFMQPYREAGWARVGVTVQQGESEATACVVAQMQQQDTQCAMEAQCAEMQQCISTQQAAQAKQKGSLARALGLICELEAQGMAFRAELSSA